MRKPLFPWARIPFTDLWLPAALGVVGTVEMALQGYQPLWVSIGSFCLAAAALVARRILAMALPLVTALIYVATPLLGFDVSQPASWMLLLGVATFSSGLHTKPSRTWIGLVYVLTALAVIMVGLDTLTASDPDLFFGLAVMVGPWIMGVTLRRARDRSHRLAFEVAEARLQAETAALRAAEAERTRIAGEFHDLLAHSLSVMTVQASLAVDLLESQPEQAAAALARIQATGRGALDDTGRLLRLMREPDDPELAPPPSVTDLPELVDEFSRLGLDVILSADSGQLPPGVGLSAYRIVQEGLTNALKHAPGSEVWVRLERETEQLTIEVENGPTSNETPVTATSGLGIVGMRERVEVFGGSLQTRPTSGGGFLVVATLPCSLEPT